MTRKRRPIFWQATGPQAWIRWTNDHWSATSEALVWDFVWTLAGEGEGTR